MVIEDIHSTKIDSSSSIENAVGEKIYLADPIDRAAAFITDIFIVLLPVLMLSNAPFKRIVFSSVLLDNNLDFAFSIIFGTLTSLFTITLYNTLSTYLLGASLGKLFVGIKVVDVWTNKKPKFLTCLLRATTWWAGFFTFGFSFSSIFTNPRRRALHDRISETIVISEKNKSIAKPSVYESSVVKGIFAGFLAFIFVITSIIVFKTHKDLSRHSQISDLLEEKGGLCSEVGQAYREWPLEIEGETPRLEVAMALFAAGNISEECLEAEATFNFRQGINTALGYLAKSFVYSDRQKLSDSYLQRVCEMGEDTHECHMSKIVGLWDQEDWEKINTEFVKVDKSWPLYVQIWAIRNSVNQGDFILSKKLLSEVPDIESLKNFKINFKVKSYLADYDSGYLDNITDLALSTLEDSEKINLSTWLCYQQISMGCSNAKTKSCEYFKENYSSELLTNTLFSLTALRTEYCEGRFLNEFVKISRGTQKLNEALKELKADTSKGLERLWSIYNNKGIKEEVRDEAARYFLEKASEEQDLEKVSIIWKSKTPDLEWMKTGQLLFDKLLSLKLYDQTVEVGSLLLPKMEKSETLKKGLALAYFKSGDSQKAWQLIVKDNSQLNSRSPASQKDDYEEMLSYLKRENLQK